jgi:hypothetical protein
MRQEQAKSVAFSLGLVLLGVLLGTIAGWFLRSSQLNDDYRSYAPMHRPKSVPENAAWAGGPEGGAYIDCYYNKLTGFDECTTYNDWTGDAIVSGSFVLDGQSRGATPPELRYSWFDGERIGLDMHTPDGKTATLVRAKK